MDYFSLLLLLKLISLSIAQRGGYVYGNLAQPNHRVEYAILNSATEKSFPRPDGKLDIVPDYRVEATYIENLNIPVGVHYQATYRNGHPDYYIDVNHHDGFHKMDIYNNYVTDHDHSHASHVHENYATNDHLHAPHVPENYVIDHDHFHNSHVHENYVVDPNSLVDIHNDYYQPYDYAHDHPVYHGNNNPYYLH